MKKGNSVFSFTFIFLFAIIGAILMSGCKKQPLASSAPKKPVPSQFIGTFVYVAQNGGYDNGSGSFLTGYGMGIKLTMNGDGTGTSSLYEEAGSYSGTTSSVAVIDQCTYEISLADQNHVNITIHYVSGKDYENGVFLHNEDASKLYPNGDQVWPNLEFGDDGYGNFCFIVPGQNPLKFIKQ